MKMSLLQAKKKKPRKASMNYYKDPVRVCVDCGDITREDARVRRKPVRFDEEGRQLLNVYRPKPRKPIRNKGGRTYVNKETWDRWKAEGRSVANNVHTTR